jgi:hypothetical protein
MSIACGRIPYFIVGWVGLAWAHLASAGAAPLGDPQFGPIARSPKPLILIADVRNPQSYGNVDIISGLMTGISDGNYAKKAELTAAAVRKAAPTLDIQQLMREAFRCGSEGAMCTELVAIGELAPKQSIDEAAQALLEARRWNEARLLAVWWDNRDGLTTHASLREVTLTEKRQLKSEYPVLMGYVITAPEGAEDPNAAAWGPDPTVPKEATIRESMVQLEPLAQFALSWAQNNNPKLYHDHIVNDLSMVRRLKKFGVRCKGLKNCNEVGVGFVESRIWTWRLLEIPMGSDRPQVWELLSRPHPPVK